MYTTTWLPNTPSTARFLSHRTGRNRYLSPTAPNDHQNEGTVPIHLENPNIPTLVFLSLHESQDLSFLLLWNDLLLRLAWCAAVNASPATEPVPVLLPVGLFDMASAA